MGRLDSARAGMQLRSCRSFSSTAQCRLDVKIADIKGQKRIISPGIYPAWSQNPFNNDLLAPPKETKPTLEVTEATPDIFLKPLRHHPKDFPRVGIVTFRSTSKSNVEFFCDFALRTAYSLQMRVGRPSALPVKIQRWHTNKSPFAHAKAKEVFERRTHSRSVEIFGTNVAVIKKMEQYLELHNLKGVDMAIEYIIQRPLNSRIVRQVDRSPSANLARQHLDSAVQRAMQKDSDPFDGTKEMTKIKKDASTFKSSISHITLDSIKLSDSSETSDPSQVNPAAADAIGNISGVAELEGKAVASEDADGIIIPEGHTRRSGPPSVADLIRLAAEVEKTKIQMDLLQGKSSSKGSDAGLNPEQLKSLSALKEAHEKSVVQYNQSLDKYSGSQKKTQYSGIYDLKNWAYKPDFKNPNSFAWRRQKPSLVYKPNEFVRGRPVEFRKGAVAPRSFGNRSAAGSAGPAKTP